MAAEPPRIGHDGDAKPDPAGSEITRGLAALRRGETGAFDRLIPLLYDELRRMARGRLRSERSGHTLDTTALVHESYLRLVTQHGLKPEDRSAFFAAASNTMRRILVDHARSRRRLKRGGDQAPVTLEDGDLFPSERAIDETLALEDALGKLETAHPRAARVFEQRLFGGLELEEIAEAEGISLRTAGRDWQTARAWLRVVVGSDLDGR
jgi:RNA polymerase sigma factor (TIGR02999 family)